VCRRALLLFKVNDADSINQSVTNKLSLNNKGGISGSADLKFTPVDGVTIKGSLGSGGDINAKVEHSGAVKGLKVAVNADIKDSVKAKGSFEYHFCSYAAATGSVDSTGKATATLSSSHEGMVAGVSAAFSAKKSLHDVVIKSSYSGHGVDVAAELSKNFDAVTLAASRALNSDTTVASEFKTSLSSLKHVFTVGAEKKLSATETARVKFNSDMHVSAAYTAKITSSATMKVSGTLNAANLAGDVHKVGAALSFKL